MCYQPKKLIFRRLSFHEPHKVKVPWVNVCRPKEEEDLVLKMGTDWNRAVLLKHFWDLFFDTNSENLGVDISFSLLMLRRDILRCGGICYPSTSC